MKRLFLIIVVLLSTRTLFAQQPKSAEANRFSIEALPSVILNELNRFRSEKGLDTLESYPMLHAAADMSSQDMADEGSEKTTELTSAKYLETVGATKKGRELTMKAVISKGREDFKTEEVAKVIYTRWENNEKNLAVLLESKFTLCGVAATMDEEGEKVYVSIFLGGYDIVNDGIKYKKQLDVPFNTASAKLKAPDPRTCKTCESWRNYDLLYKGLYVDGEKIMLRYPNARELRRFLKKPKDGIAIDVVQRSQYTNAFYNIVDNNLQNKGVMGKVLYKDNFFKKNLLITKDKKANRKVKGIEVQIGKLNPKITGPYELNLIVVQNGKVCKTITRGYNEKNTVASNTPIGLLPIKEQNVGKGTFDPRTESSILNFTIPFLKNKFEFKEEDIQPFLKALNEPDFIIEGLYIYAYSSIEGDSIANSKLQQKRAESVVNILQQRQKNKITPTILNRDSWGLFLLENEDGKFADVVNLGKAKAIQRINNDKKLLEELEPILARERFAQIILDVTYDLSGDKEKLFARVSFDRAVKAGNTKQAHKILEFITKRITEGKYTADILDSLTIPEIEKNVSLANNRIYQKYLLTNTVDEDDAAVFEKLLKMQPTEPILQYNTIFCTLKLDSAAGNADHQQAVQQTIDQLYSKLDSNFVNGLNIEWQFKIMESVDTLSNAELIVDACINRIKSFYNIKEATWQNAMKLSDVFVRAKDYSNAATILEPWIRTPQVNENLVFLYISAASRVKEKYYSRTFSKALEIAKEKNSERYCQLFGEPFMTFQVLENPDVKKTYQLSCGSK